MRPAIAAFEEQGLTAPARAIGVDEVGRGAAAGPVVACAVRLRDADPIADIAETIRDSKRLSRARRERIAEQLRHRVDWTLRARAAGAIDATNIRVATLACMAEAVRTQDRSGTIPALIDGRDIPPGIPHPILTAPKADTAYLEVAAAAILAKVFRDRLMARLARRWPAYAWEENAGYLTAGHRAAIRHHGPSPHHRATFLRRLLD